MFCQTSVAVAVSLEPGIEKEIESPPMRRKGRNYTPHQRLILKAQALFPGCEIVAHRDGKESQG